MNKIATPTLQRLLASHGLQAAGKTFVDIFMGIYIWKLTEDLTLVALFFLPFVIVHTISFTLFANPVKRGHIHVPRRIGLLGVMSIVVIVAFLGERSIDYLMPIAIGYGLFNGMYWISYHVLRFDLTRPANRGNYIGMEKAIKRIVGVVMPALGGSLIALNLFDLNYGAVFIFTGFLYLLSFFVGNVKIKHKKMGAPLHLRETIKVLRKNKDIVKATTAYIFTGISRGGAMQKLIPILIFDILNSEFQLGGWLSLVSVVSIIMSVLVGKFLHYRHYRKAISIAGVIFFISILSLVGVPGLVTYLVFAIVKGLVILYITIPKQVVSDNLIHSVEDHNAHRVEYIVIREWFGVGLGRTFSYIMLLFAVGVGGTELKIILTIMAFAALAEVWLLGSINKNWYTKKDWHGISWSKSENLQ